MANISFAFPPFRFATLLRKKELKKGNAFAPVWGTKENLLHL